MNRGNWKIAAALVVLSACGGGGAYEQELGTNGGTVSTPDGVTIHVPAGALAQPTTISVTPAPDAPTPGGVTLVGAPYTFGPEGTQFAVPVAVTLPYDPAKLPAGFAPSSLTIYTAHVGTSEYTPLATAIVDATHVWAYTTHFSTFLVGAGQAGASDGGPQDGGSPACAAAGLGASCSSDADCCTGNCLSGICSQDHSGSQPACVYCGSVCTHLSNDPENCGSCGNACSNNQVCVSGGCVYAADGGIPDGGYRDAGGSDAGGSDGGYSDGGTMDGGIADGGAPTDGCPADAGRGSFCGGSYVDLDCDLHNCGACGTACPTGEICTDGHCG